jgi:hypothetical protein
MAFPIGWSLLANGLTTAQSGGTCTPWPKMNCRSRQTPLRLTRAHGSGSGRADSARTRFAPMCDAGVLGLWGLGLWQKLRGQTPS